MTVARRITLLRGFLYVCVQARPARGPIHPTRAAVLTACSQCFGALVGTWLCYSLDSSTFDRTGGGVNGSRLFSSGAQITAEFAATALLVFTVFAVVDPGRNQSVIHVAALGPFAIGMAVFVAHIALIPITGARRETRICGCMACGHVSSRGS